MFISLLDLLSSEQMFKVLRDFSVDNRRVTYANLRRWMLDNGFTHDEIKDGTWSEDYARRSSVNAFLNK